MPEIVRPSSGTFVNNTSAKKKTQSSSGTFVNNIRKKKKDTRHPALDAGSLSLYNKRMQEKQSYVYILSNLKHNVFYTGITSDLTRRMYEHKNKLIKGFTSKYNVNILLYYEIHSDINEAILREKKLKHWRKDWKWALIDKINKDRKDLYYNGEIFPVDPASSAG